MIELATGADLAALLTRHARARRGGRARLPRPSVRAMHMIASGGGGGIVGLESIQQTHKFISSVSVLQACQSEFATLSSGVVSTWPDLSGNGKDYTQATSTKRPAFGTITVNGFPALSFDGVDDELLASLTLPAPGTTPTYLRILLRQIAWGTPLGIVGQASGTSAHTLYQFTTSPELASFNAANGCISTHAAIGSWYRIEVYWSNSNNVSTGDFLKVGSAAAVTGTNAGNNSSTASRVIGRFGTTGNFSNFATLGIIYTAGLPSTDERAKMDANDAAKYDGLIEL